MICALAVWIAATDVHFALEASTNVPIDIGGKASIDLPLGLEITTELGVMPALYADAINGVLQAAHVYPPSSDYGTLVRAGLQSSFAWRSQLGFRPWQSLGLYVAAGYTLLTLGGGLTAAQTAAAANPNAPALPFDQTQQVHVATTMHLIDAEIGYRLLFFDRLVVRAAIGGAFTVASMTQVSADNLLLDQWPAFRQQASAIEASLNHTLRRYGFLPVATVSVGYRFF